MVSIGTLKLQHISRLKFTFFVIKLNDFGLVMIKHKQNVNLFVIIPASKTIQDTMKNQNEHPEEFEIQVSLSGKDTAIRVKPDETSDGAPYFICDVSGNTITQLREETEGGWEQLWGELDEQEIATIGKAIKHNVTT